MGSHRQDHAPKTCPVCGLTDGGHKTVQEIANEIRADIGLPPLSPPDITTGIQKR